LLVVRLEPAGKTLLFDEDIYSEGERENGATVYHTDRHGAITLRLSPAGTGLDVRPWSELLLRQAAPAGQDGWWAVERSNWKRVAIRTAGI